MHSIDPATGSVSATVPAYELGVGLGQPVAVGDEVWASSTAARPGLVRIEPTTAVPVEFLEVSATSCCGTTLGPGGVWFTGTSEGERLIGILDPSDGEVTTTYEAPRNAAGIDTAASEEGMFFLDYDGALRRYSLP